VAASPIVAWLLVAALGIAAWFTYGWRGVAIGASGLVFWLLFQLSRTIGVMKTAAEQPLARVPSAVMFHAGLRPGLTMLQVVRTTKSLGRKVDGTDDDWVWADEGGASVRLHFARARLVSWQLERPT